MNPLIPLQISSMSGIEHQTCNARDLHAFLEVGRDFATWIKGRIEDYQYLYGMDYITKRGDFDSPNRGNQTKRGDFDSPNPANQTKRGGDRRSIEYHISTGMAKELAMLENNAKGREVRRYFIQCEERLRHELFEKAKRLERLESRPKLPLQSPRKLAATELVTEWLEQQTEYDQDHFVYAHRLNEQFSAWCKSVGHRPCDWRAFYNALRSLGYDVEAHSDAKYRPPLARGVRVIADGPAYWEDQKQPWDDLPAIQWKAALTGAVRRWIPCYEAEKQCTIKAKDLWSEWQEYSKRRDMDVFSESAFYAAVSKLGYKQKTSPHGGKYYSGLRMHECIVWP